MSRLLALLLGCALAGIFVWAGIAFGARDFFRGGDSSFGFEAHYELPRLRPDDDCGYMNGGPTSSPWIAGPHEGLDGIGPRQLAADSLAWFERSTEAGAWKDNPTARLELDYPSDGLNITARYARNAGTTWEEQLGAWFERFPPGGEGYAQADGDYSWTIALDDRGRVRGAADSGIGAVAQMRAIASTLDSVGSSEDCTFSLLLGVQESSNVSNCYGADTRDFQRLTDLPRLVDEKRQRNEVSASMIQFAPSPH